MGDFDRMFQDWQAAQESADEAMARISAVDEQQCGQPGKYLSVKAIQEAFQLRVVALDREASIRRYLRTMRERIKEL